MKKHILIPVLIFVFCIALIYGLEKENLLNSTNFKVNETPYSHLINKELTDKNESQNKIQTLKTPAQVIKQNQSAGNLNSTNNSSGNLSFST